jgi:hypothetical protein
MPRVGQGILDCVVYLYPTEQDARDGEKVGGSGFLVEVRDPFPWNEDVSPEVKNRVASDRSFASFYVVTNDHVIRGGNTVLRLNLAMHSGTDTIATDASQWIGHLDFDDVVVLPITLPKERYRASGIPLEMFYPADGERGNDTSAARAERLMAGDEAFFVGRFIGHDGKQTNSPTARFGNLITADTQRVPTSRGIDQESFLVEARSLSGYSGSPVFVYLPYQVTQRAQMPTQYDMLAMAATGTWQPTQYLRAGDDEVWFIGIDYGHRPLFERVLSEDQETPLPDKWYVKQNSGVIGVVPAWKIREILEGNAGLVKLRNEEVMQRLREADKKHSEGLVPDSVDQ